MLATLVGLALLVSTQIDPATKCQPRHYPEFTGGFLQLAITLHGYMGGALTCEFTDPRGTGDVEQRTTRGLAFWRKSTNTPTFTDGVQHWAWTPRGLVTWSSPSIDPPADALRGAGGGDTTSYRDYCDRLSVDERADAPICSLVDSLDVPPGTDQTP